MDWVGERRLPRSILLGALAATILVGLVHALVIAAVTEAPLVQLRPAWLFLVLLNWWPWAAVLPLLQRLVQWVPLAPRPRFGAVCLHAAVALLATTLHLCLSVGLAWILDRDQPANAVSVWLSHLRLENFPNMWLYRLNLHPVMYAAIVAALAARDAAKRSVIEATRSARLEEQLARAQLEVLSLQLQPHFLFNALNALAELAHEEREDARRMLHDLRGLLALSFERATRTEVTLSEELDFVRAYAAIQSRRFRGLFVHMQADAAALSARVPHLLLQPLVENAIRHGLARRGCRVEVRAWREGDDLRIDVLDDGGGLARSPGATYGLGLRNTQARLAYLHGAAQRLELDERPEGGVRARVALPFRTAESPG